MPTEDDLSWKRDGDEILLNPERGRILQVRKSGIDALWENPGWTGGWNIGGDRVWVGPENSWFWRQIDELNLSNHHVPSVMDSDNWIVRELNPYYCCLQKVVELHHLRDDSFVRFEITREIEWITAAAQTEGSVALTFQIAYRLTVLDGTPGTSLDLWALTQIPAGGRVFVPMRRKFKYRNYLSPIPDELWLLNNGLLELEINGKHLYKIGIPPEVIVGEMIYRRPVEDEHYLIIRRLFVPIPRQSYCDVPIYETDSPGDAIQVFNDGGDFGGYGEMEYHTPSIYVKQGFQILEDKSITSVELIKRSEWNIWYRNRSMKQK